MRASLVDQHCVAARVRYVEAVLGAGPHVGRALSGVHVAHRLKSVCVEDLQGQATHTHYAHQTIIRRRDAAGLEWGLYLSYFAPILDDRRGAVHFVGHEDPTVRCRGGGVGKLSDRRLARDLPVWQGYLHQGIGAFGRHEHRAAGIREIQMPGRLRQLHLPHRLSALAVDQPELVGVAEGHGDQPGLGIGRNPFRRGTDLDHPAGGFLLERRPLGWLRRRGRSLLRGVLFSPAAHGHEQNGREREQREHASKRRVLHRSPFPNGTGRGRSHHKRCQDQEHHHPERDADRKLYESTQRSTRVLSSEIFLWSGRGRIHRHQQD